MGTCPTPGSELPTASRAGTRIRSFTHYGQPWSTWEIDSDRLHGAICAVRDGKFRCILSAGHMEVHTFQY